MGELPERSNGAVSGCFYRLPTSANGSRFGKCLIYAAASSRGAADLGVKPNSRNCVAGAPN